MQSPNRLRQAGLALLTALLLIAIWQGLILAQDPAQEQLELGAQLYGENCAVCHGPNGEGRIGPTLSKDWPSIRPDLRVKSVIQSGVPGSAMPAWSQDEGGPLTEEEIEAITAYILSWETGGIPPLPPTPAFTPPPPITPIPDVVGDPNRGAVLYAENCTVCHGPNGGGRAGARLAKNWPAIRPDLRIKATIRDGVPGSIMPAWSQENGGPLTDENINDIVAFVMSWQGQAPPESVEPAAPQAPSVFSGPLGAVVVVVGLLALVLLGAIGAISRRGEGAAKE